MEVFFHSNEEKPTKSVLNFFRGSELIKFIYALLNGIYSTDLHKRGWVALERMHEYWRGQQSPQFVRLEASTVSIWC